MAKWIRMLSRPAGASGQWHVLASDKEFAIADALCGEKFPGAVEVASGEDRTERDGRCSACEARLTAKQQEALTAVQHRSR
jgi:hypothetical protein